jgi:hypothetical protein
MQAEAAEGLYERLHREYERARTLRELAEEIVRRRVREPLVRPRRSGERP